MKRFFYIFASLLLLAGCTDKLNVEGLQVQDGEMAVNLKVSGPMAGPHTRSYVSGQETAISTIKMLCFDKFGTYITSCDGEVHATDDTHGTLTGKVPANTSRIHFVANFEGLDLSSVDAGSLERIMMKSDALSSGIDDDVRFWGYHREDTPGAMASYLTSNNTVILIRDRAKVTVLNSDSDITSLRWTISNGLNKGFVATASSTDNANPYDNNYENSTVLTEYRSSGTYTLSDIEKIWTGPGANNPQFLFENANSTNPVKIIIEAHYQDGSTRYHTILLQDNDKKLYRITRNESFVLTIKDLPSASETTSIGSDTFDDALTTTQYSNNPFAQVAPEVDEVNDDQFTLKVEKVFKFFDTGSTGTISFTFQKHNGSGTDYSKEDFEVEWEPKDDTDESLNVSSVNPTVTSYNSDGEGIITIQLDQITSDLKFSTLRLVAPSGLTRYVDVYSITKFVYSSDPELVDNHTTRPVNGIPRETYKLTFSLSDDLPDVVYPMTVKMYTGTLVPFSDDTPSAPHNSFNFTVGSTSMLDATDQSAEWNYNANKWDGWYEYVISEPSENNSYTLYLNEFNFELYPGRTINTVGLYFEIEHFGTRKALFADAPEMPESRTVSFSPSNFSLNSNSNSSASYTNPDSNITIAFAQSRKPDGNSYIQVGGNGSNGTMTVSSGNGSKITGIEVTFSSSSSSYYDYTSGPVSVTSGNYSKSGTTGTWSGVTDNVTLTFTLSDQNDRPRITAIKVTYVSL